MTLNLTTEPEGAVGWATAINQNFTDIQAAVNAAPGVPTASQSTLSSDFSTTSSTYTDSGLSISFTMPRTQAVLVFAVLRVEGFTGVTAAVRIVDASSNVIAEGVAQITAGVEHMVTLVGVQTPSSGSNTWKVQAKADGTNTISIYATGGSGFGRSTIGYLTNS